MKKKILPSETRSSNSVKSTLRIFVLLMIAVAATSLESAARGSALELSLWNNSSFIVEFDGRRYPADCSFIIRDLKPGSHKMRVYSESFHHHGGHVTIHYDGCVNIPARAMVIAQVTANKRLDIERVMRYVDRPLYAANECAPVPYDVHNCSSHCNHSDHQFHETNYHAHENCFDSYSFNGLLEQIDNAYHDEDRLRIAKQAVQRRMVTSRQVAMIMEKMWFENTRLQFAKFAFARTMDQENYYVVNDVFWFSGSIRELDEFIEEQSFCQH